MLLAAGLVYGALRSMDAALVKAFNQIYSNLCHGCRNGRDAAAQLAALQQVTFACQKTAQAV